MLDTLTNLTDTRDCAYRAKRERQEGWMKRSHQ
jgi:hypothetical protein